MKKSELANLPNYIYCSITGIKYAVRRDVILQRIKAAGSLERLQKTYVSRSARRLLKEGKSIEQIREELGFDPEHANNGLTLNVARNSSSMARARIREGDHIDTFWRAESWRVEANWDRRPLTPTQIEETTRDTCLNPPRWYDKDCTHCQYFANCTLITKGVYRK